MIIIMIINKSNQSNRDLHEVPVFSLQPSDNLPIAPSTQIRYNVLYTQTFVFPGRTQIGRALLCRPRGLVAGGYS